MNKLNSDLVEEIEFMIDLLAKSGFFSVDEIKEILEDQFIDEEIDFSQFSISLNNSSNENFSKLEKAFINLANEGIIAIHNCGYDIEEGVCDAFELQVHLLNNKFKAQGFCFYTFEDVEQAIEKNILKLTFGDFQRDENKSLEIGNIVYQCLIDANFQVNWDNTVNSPIEIINFNWDKKYDEDTEYEIEGAYDLFTGVMNEK